MMSMTTPSAGQKHPVLILLIMLVFSMGAQAETRGVAFHLDRLDHMNRSILQVSRHLQGNTNTPVTVVFIGDAVHALLDGAVDSHGGAYSAQLEQLLAQGAELYACSNTLDSLAKTNADLILGAETVPSGIAELGRLQVEEDYGYIKL